MEYRIISYIFLFASLIYYSVGLQCYSCRGTAPNEVEANIRCLEASYLEDCDDFYTYYSEVEDQNVLSYEYYEYEKPVENEKKPRGKSRELRPRARKRPLAKEGERPERGQERSERGQQRSERVRRQARRIGETSALDYAEERYNDLNSDVARETALNDAASNYDYEYNYGDYNYTYNDVEQIKPTDTPRGGSRDTDVIALDDDHDEDDDEDEEDLKLPKDPEHHCYSRTLKKTWESYTVEKGCKKISYCKSLTENNPEWTHPWNFCCDKTRCNAKLVKDKPQRIFGMGCRHTDDCIQGMTSRPVCPNWFQSCPKISSSLVKMECRAKTRSNKNKYYYAAKEKKCYCAPGFSPKGPICASGCGSLSSRQAVYITVLMYTLLYLGQK